MVTSLEIIERSIYDCILQTAVKLGLTLDPSSYYPITPETLEQFKTDKAAISKYVTIFGAGNAESKGERVTPRIVIDNDTLFPGVVGFDTLELEKESDGYKMTQIPSKSLNHIINIHICVNNQADYRILQTIISKSLPLRGYIKNYLHESLQESGNIYLELVNGYDNSDELTGIIEKVFQYELSDVVLLDSLITSEEVIIPLISDITLITNNQTLITK